jgi:NitT/TauT family transport system permease protein
MNAATQNSQKQSENTNQKKRQVPKMSPNSGVAQPPADGTRVPRPGALWAVFALAAALLSLAHGLALPAEGQTLATVPGAWREPWGLAGLLGLMLAGACGVQVPSRLGSGVLAVAALVAGLCWAQLPPAQGDAEGAAGFWLPVLSLAALAVLSIQRLALLDGKWIDRWLAAAVFGLWVLVFWQVLTLGLGVPRVLLPAPSFIGAALVEHADKLGGDFVQTVLKSVVVGWVLGCGLGFGVAIAIDRAPFLQRGLLPLASLTSTVPLVGVAPIAVMWFGFDWPSKAAVVVLMTFFPMLVSTLAGLQAADKLQRELMHTYAASYTQTLRDLRLPSAFPFVVGALKVNATLALIGAIVAEFFGSPTAGLGFRISTEASRMNMPLVWGAIAVAAVTGSVAYALLVRLERRVAFWHPSVRSAT